MERSRDSQAPLAKASVDTSTQARRPKRRQLKIASQAEFPARSRIFMYEMSELFCKILPAYSQHMDNDLSKLLIISALGASNVQRLMATPQSAAFASLDVRIPPELQMPANALSIADATGLPRETVRRKLKELVTSGLAVEDERGGYRVRPGVLQGEALQAAYYANFRAMADVLERCLEAGLIELE